MILKKKEFAIYAIALMLVAAGYFNYLNFDFKALQTSASVEKNTTNTTSSNEQSSNENKISDIENSQKISENEVQDNKVSAVQNEQITNEKKASDNEIENITNQTELETEANNDNQVEVSSEETKEKNDENKTNIGDAVLVSSNETVDDLADMKDYFASTKLQRNQMYAEMIKKYEDLINNPNLSEVQKSIATEEITKINNNKNAIMICENLILSKDFEECVILINDQSVNIVVHIDDGLNTERVSQIQNIISRELLAEIENIHISEK